MNNTIRTIAAAAARLTVAAIISSSVLTAAVWPAKAQAPDQAPSRVVSIAGLDLGTQAGQAALAHRLNVAARQVCQTETPRNADFQDCYRQAMANAREQVFARQN